MHSTSPLWDQILAEPDHQVEVKATINGTEYGQDRIIKVTISGRLYNSPSVGNAISRTLELEIVPYNSPNGKIPPMSEIRLYVRLVSADGQRVSEYIPKGVFYADTVRRDKDTGAATVSAFDAIMKMEKPMGDRSCTITFADGFGGVQKYSRNIGDNMPTPSTPENRDGYRFTGWYPDPADTDKITHDERTVAQWAEITSTEITSYPAKTDYAVGETLDYTGLTVTATYSDGFTEDITAKCTVLPTEGTEITEVGDIMVDVRYNGKSLGTFRVAAQEVIAKGDWWTLYTDGTLDIYCVGRMPARGWYSYRNQILSVTIGNSVTNIVHYAFDSCASLTSVRIPDSVTSIDEGAFEYCNGLTDIAIPDSVTSIGESAFQNCTRLTGVTIPDSVTKIKRSTFVGCIRLTSVRIPDSVTSIDYGAFQNCTSLTSVTIPDSVTWIGEVAFRNCASLISVTIPAGVSYIGNDAFTECISLTNVTILGGVANIGYRVFSSCASLRSVTIGYGFAKIGATMFGGCTSLTDIAIPDSVTSIDYGAFQNCTSLRHVYYSGNQSQWRAISIGSGNDPLTKATIHYNSTGPS